ENSLMGVYQCSLANFCCMISQHADGELIAEIARHLRLQTVRGSSTRGGIEAMRKLLRVSRKMHLGLTVDGPRGPRRRMQPGLIYLASRSGLPIVPIGFGNQRPWRLNTWDQFILPKPYSLTTCITGKPIFVPPNLDKAQIEYYRQVVEKQISYVNDLAVSWVETGRLLISQKPLALAG
ncbi:MAG TPA: lysophospholipid acyltransferase family protein, partial [Gemmataceae bacterium]|nr:lysophospholipid acyltransferase family protein [Gemmataceae bacterium]